MTSERNDMQLKAAKRALSLVTEAMDLVDAHDVGPDIGMHLAMAQQQLRQLVGSGA
jgi:hypothetical protein